MKNFQKAVRSLKTAMAVFATCANLKLCVSAGNSKIGRIKNVSVAPGITCHGVCSTCVEHCYDMKAVLQYKNVVNARARNTVILRYEPMEFFVQALRTAKNQKKGLFRWNVGGEIDSMAHFQMIVKIAELVPGTKFLLFTKRHFLVNSYVEKFGNIPSNLKLIFSVWPGMEIDNPSNFPTSCPYPDEEPKNWIKCIGNCETCAKLKIGCWNAEKGETIGFHYHGNEVDNFKKQWEGMRIA